MAILLVFALFIFLFVKNDCLKCIHSFNTLTIEKDNLLYDIEQDVKDLTTSEDTMCAVEITMIYAARRLEIRFDRNFQPVDLTLNVHLRVNTSIIPSTGKSTMIVNILQFSCNNKDECDRRFFFDHIDWLLNAKYDELTDIIRPSIVSGTKSGTNRFFYNS
jgi:hypothetical protein